MCPEGPDLEERGEAVEGVGGVDEALRVVGPVHEEGRVDAVGAHHRLHGNRVIHQSVCVCVCARARVCVCACACVCVRALVCVLERIDTPP